MIKIETLEETHYNSWRNSYFISKLLNILQKLEN